MNKWRNALGSCELCSAMMQTHGEVHVNYKLIGMSKGLPDCVPHL